VTSASMVNREGQTVAPTTTAIRSGTQPLSPTLNPGPKLLLFPLGVHAAMEAMSDQIQEGSYTLNITNAPRTPPHTHTHDRTRTRTRGADVVVSGLQRRSRGR
jgi:hypothetical protein